MAKESEGRGSVVQSDVGKTITAKPNPGYKFDHWDVSLYNSQQSFTDSSQTITYNYLQSYQGYDYFYANFTYADYTVTFDAKGGTVNPDQKTYTYKSTYHDLPTPTRMGYDFAGWYLGNTHIKNGDSFEQTAPCTLEAHWTAKSFSVSVDGKNCNLNVSKTEGHFGDSITITWSPFQKVGSEYVFNEMVVRTKDKTILRSYQETDSPATFTMNESVGYYSEIVVAGGYTIQGVPYTIQFDGNGGTTTEQSIKTRYGETVSLPTAQKTTRKGYTLSGWRGGSKTGTRYALGAEVSNLTTTSGYIYTFYADWAANVSTNVYNRNGADSGAMANQSVTYDVPYALSLNQYSRTGYAFAGWTTNLSHVAEFKDGATVSNLTSAAGGMVNFYATWQANSYHCSFQGNGADSGSVSTKDVHYDEIFKLPADGFNRTGYTLSGWRAGSPTGGRVSLGASVSNLTAAAGATYTFYADWTANVSTNVYNGNGADSGKMEEQQARYGESYRLAANGFARTGYTFAGWTTNLQHSAEFTDSAIVSNLTSVSGGKVDFYATWQANDYRCIFDGNGATSGEVASMDVQYDQVFTLPANGFERSGFAFSGWGTNATEGTVFQPGDSLSNLTSVANAEVPIYARWQAQKYEITFSCEEPGSTVSLTNQLRQFNEEFDLPSEGVKCAGYQLAGWTNKTAQVFYELGETVSNLTTTAGSTVTLWAVMTLREGLTDLNTALDYYGSPVSNVVIGASMGWDVTNNHVTGWVANIDVGEVPVTIMRRRMNTRIVGPARVSFKICSKGLEEGIAQLKLWWGESADGIGGDLLTNIVQNTSTWETVSVDVKSGEKFLVWDLKLEEDYFEKECTVDIDELKITHDDPPHPVPQPSDAPTVSSAGILNGKFGIGFVGDARFDYQLLGTESLQPANWQPVDGTLQSGAGASQQIEVTFDPLKPSMFYKVQVLQKQ